MSLWDRLPSSFRFTVQDTPQKDIVKVFDGRLPGSGRTVQVAPFAKANMEKVAQIIARLRTQKKPAIEYITNQFVDIHRSSGRSHVVGAILTNEETKGDYFDLDVAAKQGLANKMVNCDRANAAGNRLMSLFDIKDPVLYHWTTAGNHNTGLVGDPRMPKYGEKNTVVMDTHPVFPMPHTLAEASYQVRIPREGEEGHADLEIWDPQKNPASRFDASHLPARISDQQQTDWLQERGWPTEFGADVVKAWHDTEVRETGKAPDRWQYLFSCKDPSVRYDDGEGNIGANNNFPLEFVRQRTEAFLQLHKAYPEDASHSQGMALEGARLPGRRSSRLAGEPQALPIARDTPMPDAGPSDTAPPGSDIMPRPAIGMAFQHVTPMDTIVTDLHTGEVLMEMHGSQVPVDKVNHGFPIKDPQKPWAIHPEYVSPTDPFRCHDNVKIGRVEFPQKTKEIMWEHSPDDATEDDYFAKRAAEVKAEYEAPLPPNNAKPPSATQWRPKKLSADECYGTTQAKSLEGKFGVVPVDYKKQNVGGMGPAFAGAMIKKAAHRRQYIAQTSKAAFDDFSMRAGNPKNPAEVARFAPYGGGNLAQFMNGKASPEEQAHFIAVDVIVHTTNKYGEPRRVVAPHFFQIAEVPEGKQAILDYGDGNYFYGGNRPGMSSGAADLEVKSEPVDDDDVRMDDVPMPEAITPSALALRHKRPAQSDGAQEPKRRQMASTLGDSIPHGAAAALDSSRRNTRTPTATALRARLQRQQSPAAGIGSDARAARGEKTIVPEEAEESDSSLSSLDEDVDFEEIIASEKKGNMDTPRTMLEQLRAYNCMGARPFSEMFGLSRSTVRDVLKETAPKNIGKIMADTINAFKEKKECEGFLIKGKKRSELPHLGKEYLFWPNEFEKIFSHSEWQAIQVVEASKASASTSTTGARPIDQLAIVERVNGMLPRRELSTMLGMHQDRLSSMLRGHERITNNMVDLINSAKEEKRKHRKLIVGKMRGEVPKASKDTLFWPAEFDAIAYEATPARPEVPKEELPVKQLSLLLDCNGKSRRVLSEFLGLSSNIVRSVLNENNRNKLGENSAQAINETKEKKRIQGKLIIGSREDHPWAKDDILFWPKEFETIISHKAWLESLGG